MTQRTLPERGSLADPGWACAESRVSSYATLVAAGGVEAGPSLPLPASKDHGTSSKHAGTAIDPAWLAHQLWNDTQRLNWEHRLHMLWQTLLVSSLSVQHYIGCCAVLPTKLHTLDAAFRGN